jgi:uncharacterized membrane protein YbhN (UPF0104 family)
MAGFAAQDPLAALGARDAARPRAIARRLAPLGVLAALVVAVAVAAPRIAGVFADALVRAIHADPRWAVAAVAFEMLSFGGYIALFWHVAGRSTPRFGLRASYEVSLAGTAATRLLPTAGAGGAALTFWSLKRASNDGATATRTLLTFLVVLYSVFLAALATSGALLATGAVDGGAPLQLSALPAGAALLAIAVALLLAGRRSQAPGHDAPRLRRAAHALGGAVRDALGLVRRPHPRLLGALAWWGFDMLVIWAAFNAFGRPPAAAVLVLGYFLGQIANTVPLPGAASGGMVGAFLALGMPAAVVLPAVLTYRAIAIWTPVPAGAAAITGLRRTVRRWAVEDEARSAAEGDASSLHTLLFEPASLRAGALGERVEVEPLEPAGRRKFAQVDPHRELSLHA